MGNPSLHGHIQSPHYSEKLADPTGVADTSWSFLAFSGDTLELDKRQSL